MWNLRIYSADVIEFVTQLKISFAELADSVAVKLLFPTINCHEVQVKQTMVSYIILRK